MSVAVQSAPLAAHQLVFEPQQLPRLRSNHGGHLDRTMVGYMRETPLDTPVDEMRRRFEEDGYVFVKGVMPREDVLDMREKYFEHMRPTGILKPGTSPREGIFNSGEDAIRHGGVGPAELPEDQGQIDKLVSAHSMSFYLAFVEHPQLRAFVRLFMQWREEVLVKRTLLRHNVPGGISTGIHYDRLFLRKGEAEFLTAWVPIGDCPFEAGGLMYLENSSDLGRKMETEFQARAADFSEEERLNAFNVNMMRDGQLSHNAVQLTADIANGVYGSVDRSRRWLVGNYEAGDVVFHDPYMIHGAVKNEDEQGRIRLSTDLRFYECGSDLDDRWMRNVWRPGDGL